MKGRENVQSVAIYDVSKMPGLVYKIRIHIQSGLKKLSHLKVPGRPRVEADDPSL